MPPRLVTKGLRATGRWPVLLALVHGAVRDASEEGGDPTAELSEVLAALRIDGITALDVQDPGERSKAVAATIEVSLRRLTPDEQARYLELAVFGEDVPVPGDVVARLWRHTGGWSRFQSRRLCQRLFDLGLLPELPSRRRSSRSARRDSFVLANQGAAAACRVECRRDRCTPGPRPSHGGWDEVPLLHDYLWSWLVEHLWAARLHDELEEVLANSRWLVKKLELTGPAGLESDLRLSKLPTPHALETVRSTELVHSRAARLHPARWRQPSPRDFRSTRAWTGCASGPSLGIYGPHIRTLSLHQIFPTTPW